MYSNPERAPEAHPNRAPRNATGAVATLEDTFPGKFGFCRGDDFVAYWNSPYPASEGSVALMTTRG